MEVIDVGLQCHFRPFWLTIMENSACPRDNASQIWASITKFSLNMHPGILLVGKENGGYRTDLDLQGHFDSKFYEIRLVRGITRHRFGLESPNLHQTCILGYSQLVLKIEVIDLAPRGHFGHFDLEFLQIWLLCMITGNGFEQESPHLHQICILGFSQVVLEMGSLTLTFSVVWPSFRLKKLHSTLLLYTDLGRPRGATRPKRALVQYFNILL